MQVKKFEAKTMQEALLLVKSALGPDAIILSAKESHKGFGVAGSESVEVTAAVTEETLRKKQLAEMKLSQELKNKFQMSSAKTQRSFIEKASLSRSGAPLARKEERRALTQVPYIDINDEQEFSQRPQQQRGSRREAQRPQSKTSRPQSSLSGLEFEGEINPSSPVVAQRRIRAAAQRAFAAFDDNRGAAPTPARRQALYGQKSSEQNRTKQQLQNLEFVNQAQTQRVGLASQPQLGSEIQGLKSEIQQLKLMMKTIGDGPGVPQSLHPGAEHGLGFELSPSYQKLQRAGVSSRLSVSLLKEAEKSLSPEQRMKPGLVDGWLARKIHEQIRVTTGKSSEKYQIFIGAEGQGKTSTLVKIASQAVIREKKKVAIVSLDHERVGALEQLKIYCQILNIPFIIVKKPSDWAVIEEKFGDRDQILVDTPGSGFSTQKEIDQLNSLFPPISAGRRIHLVLSAWRRDDDLFALASRAQILEFQDVIFTGLDQTARHGLLLNFLNQFPDLSLHSFGMGPGIPEDWELATRERVVDLIFKISNLKKRGEKNDSVLF